MDKRGGQEAVKGLGLRKIFYIPESMVVPEGSSPESGLELAIQKSHWRQVASCSLLLHQNLTKRWVVIDRIDG